MDENGASFVAVRRLSQGLDRGGGCHSSSGDLSSICLTYACLNAWNFFSRCYI